MNKIFSKYIFISVLLSCVFTAGFSQMRKVYSDPVEENDIIKINFFSNSEGFVAFRDWIGYTTDSGRTFFKKTIGITNVDYNGFTVNLTFGLSIAGIKAFNKDTLLAYGHYGLVPSILHSTDGGSTFKLIHHSQYNHSQFDGGMKDMTFPENGNIGFAIDSDRILKTINRGLTWTTVRHIIGSNFDYIDGVDDNNVYVFSNDYNKGSFLTTENGGGSWEKVNIPIGQTIDFVDFLTESTGWLNCRDNDGGRSIFYTTNGGINWKLKNHPKASPFTSKKMRFVDDSTGYAIKGFEVYKTTDSGRTWQQIARDNNFSYYDFGHNDLQVLNRLQIWAGGANGLLEVSTKHESSLIIKAHFLIDTTNFWQTQKVNLSNYTKPGYQYSWYVNNESVGNTYNASYIRNPKSLLDSIKLIVSNGIYHDTIVQYQSFHPLVTINSFFPTMGGTGTVVTIKGKNLYDTKSVFFGWFSASSFTVLSDSVISATVGLGMSGNVIVTTSKGIASQPGFSFTRPPVILSYTPASAKAGTLISITGENFNDVTDISFGGIAATTFKVITPNSIEAILGVGNSGNVLVKAVGGTATLPGFVALPDILSFTPAKGTFGTNMVITGSGFTGVTSVSVGGVEVSSFKINSPTSITAIIKSEASGEVVVKTIYGSSKLSGFTYNQPPTISGFLPASGPIGTQVTIAGTNFDPVPANNTVYFGAVKATVISSSFNSLDVIVPVEATFQSISITTNNLTAFSQKPFIVTFVNGGSLTSRSLEIKMDLPKNNYSPFDVVNGDLDGDGKSDLLILRHGVNIKDNTVWVFKNESTTSEISYIPHFEFYIPDPGGIVLRDFDGDSKLDFAITDGDYKRISIFRNISTDDSISFAAPVNFSAKTSGKLSAEDLDGDGKPDIVLSNWWEIKLIILRNISNPGVINFENGITLSGASGHGLIHDLDNDGKPDIVVANSIFRNKSVKGSLSFDLPISYAAIPYARIAVGDIDGDGVNDIISSNSESSKISIFRNIGTNNIAFAPPVEINASSTTSAISLSDLDGDGKIDIASTLYNSVEIFKNLSQPGKISFSPKINFPAGNYSTGGNLIFADANRDGKPDPILASGELPVKIFINEVKPEPFIESFSPTIGTLGTVVTITGANLMR